MDKHDATNTWTAWTNTCYPHMNSALLGVKSQMENTNTANQIAMPNVQGSVAEQVWADTTSAEWVLRRAEREIHQQNLIQTRVGKSWGKVQGISYLKPTAFL